MTVRRCRPSDADEIYRLVQEWVAICPVEYPRPVKEAIVAATEEGSKSSHFVGFVSEKEGGLDGLIVGYGSPILWNPAYAQAVILLLYVEDGTPPGKGDELLSAFENAARMAKCYEISHTFSSGHRVEAAVRFFKSKGFEQIGVDLRKLLASTTRP